MAGMAGLCALVALPAAWLTGCSDGDMLGGMGSEVEPAHGRPTAALPGPGTAESTSNALVVSPRQQDYLDALHTAGVTPSSDLSALSIGSYVCQARAARQTDQAVWAFVAPLVRNDVSGTDDSESADTPSAVDVDTATADYIRIATERLC
ncbi:MULTISPECIES: DUF732 domain-containing protein [Mycolicibacterium]|uniref:DUF732 domain-containing protein n=2 Tax=Mycolicibacterium TaxID=1866885 RepID=A1TGV8_MYCVP|nr:hypothetical protein Mvan_5643 [Mycolicibacterium vanbaalenii PYR-1]